LSVQSCRSDVTDSEELSAETLWYVRAVRETGLLDAYLTEAGTPSEAAAEADVTEASARVAARILDEIGVLERVGEEYEPSNRALGLLTKRDVRSIGSLPHRLDVLDAFAELPETMATGVPPRLSEEWSVNAVGAREATPEQVRRACVTTAVRAAPAADTVLDICGGAGDFAAEFQTRGLAATIVDSAEIVERVEPLHESRNLRTFEGPLDELPWTFDLAFWADGVCSMDAEEAKSTLVAAAASVAAEGTLVVIDRFDEAGEMEAAIRGIATGEGGAHDTDDVAEWLSDAGFSTVETESVPGADRTAVVGHR
jgi:hypothetical protein